MLGRPAVILMLCLCVLATPAHAGPFSYVARKAKAIATCNDVWINLFGAAAMGLLAVGPENLERFMRFLPALWAENSYEYGKLCADTNGVEIPPIDCLGPDATIIPITVDGKEVTDHVPEYCDRPSLLPQYKCVPGNRIIRYTATNAKGQNIETVIMCRRNVYRKIGSEEDKLFDDIAIIQHNETTSQACWFANTRYDKGPVDGTKVPSPYQSSWDAHSDEGKNEIKRSRQFWPKPWYTAVSSCNRCHDAAVWIRTPWLAQTGKLPDNPNHAPVDHVGNAFGDWKSYPSLRLKINDEAYDKIFPPTAEERKALDSNHKVSAGRCTECHYIGGNQGCDLFLKNSIGEITKGVTPNFKSTHWMPPTGRGPDVESFDKKYSRALAAIKKCCENPNLTTKGPNGEIIKVCQDKH